MLQCPRCQASVPAHPGVCGTCGENVYQCHKCRCEERKWGERGGREREGREGWV